MYRQLAKMVVYRNMEKDSILLKLAEICKEFFTGTYNKEELSCRIYEEIHRLLDIATIY
ncbi:hypothetical protein [Velocimicrobium porci]|uniref:hypothetical protein n=1 Tax=Velocimicrobium porci TaxID=2606634 RepID=UPI0012B289DC|nr:hypothetical protein [Velocimicrobium porci]